MGGPPRGPPKASAVALVSCVKLTAKLVRCAGAMAVAAMREDSCESWSCGGGGSSAWGGPPGGPPPLGGPLGGPRSREVSATTTPRTSGEGESGGESICSGAAAADAGTGRRLREEIAKRQQLQHKAAALQRRVLELTEDLNDKKMLMDQQREEGRERAKLVNKLKP